MRDMRVSVLGFGFYVHVFKNESEQTFWGISNPNTGRVKNGRWQFLRMEGEPWYTFMLRIGTKEMRVGIGRTGLGLRTGIEVAGKGLLIGDGVEL